MDYNSVCSYLNTNNIFFEKDKSTKELVSFRAGGCAKIVVYPNSLLELCRIVSYLLNIKSKFFILGNGTNVIFNDSGYEGVIISTKHLVNSFNRDEYLSADSGTPINSLCKLAKSRNLSGIECLYGIPGTVGGAVFMNASAFNTAISDVTYESLVYDYNKRLIYYLNKEEHLFSTKHSVFIDEKNLILLSTTVELTKGNKTSIQEKMDSCISKRRTTQPLSLPSAGSVFKRPRNNYASKLVDDAGLKGYTIGGAQVSKKHAGFIVNIGNASYKNIKALTELIKSEVQNQYNIYLEEEIIFIE